MPANTSKVTPPPPDSGPVFDADAILLQQRTRFNPLRTLDPQTLAAKLDQFDAGLLRDAALLWDAMARRDDTIPSVKFLREESCSSQDWQVLKVEGAPEPEASRHAAALRWFYSNVTAVNAFDRNERGGFERLVDYLMSAASYKYAVLHIRWKPQPGVSVDVEGAAAVPVLTAELEFVPLWFFENTTGLLRFLPNGGFGVNGTPLDWESGEWMSAVGPGVMFSASISYMFKRLTFQDWTIFNERYAQGKVLGQTKEAKDSAGGRGMRETVERFNGDVGFVLYGQDGTIKEPLKIIEPHGNTADVFEKFIDRQDRKVTVLFRGQDLSTMSRGGKGEKPVGASVQHEEGDKIKQADVRMVEGALQHFIDRQVIRFCFGEGVQPLAYRGVPTANAEDSETVRENAGFLADRGFKVSAAKVADQLGVTAASDDEEPLGAVSTPPPTDGEASLGSTSNASRPGPDDASMGVFLAHARIELDGGIGEDFSAFAEALARVLDHSDADLEDAFAALCVQMPAMRQSILDAARKGTADAYEPILAAGLVDGLANQDADDAGGRTGNDSLADGANFTRPVHARGAGGGFKKKNAVHLRTGKSTATEAAHVQPGDRVMIDDRPINVSRVNLQKSAARHTVHVHGKDDLGQPVHHRFFGAPHATA